MKPVTVSVTPASSSRPSMTGEVPFVPTAWLHTETASFRAFFSQEKRMAAHFLSFIRNKFYIVVLV